ncbi:SAM-dependent methyltransferase [Dickeya solani]|uniref:SAM-dependent methyltransferase (Cyclopropane fatty acid synthase-related) n=1 Tax=Dickeya solani D s0432-1 TaxID=1231725 RepID=A0AAV3KFV5_9GAMM|nr:methyltransferase domain-containing protein [Dickeya solani]ANE75859.1 methyltransferase [Dickeya solani IPO 2222]AUC43354.1 Methyltransferase [Dickeya solani RNS 08.23.3.1.A]AYQ46287.1 Demethylrebeccamycin-D-glucose O-methyltransferase [Dickeya solani]AYQ50458.1 Demethylrebeccamycin-D-glucose O-methyltransferase [Dickeya solani]ERO59454.1 SAM-dependent methyltransferase (Cyclopropane fatty acid synthase-related) [Dickeya solani D s0432-1]
MNMVINTPFTDGYDNAFLLDTMMGPNAMRITEEMAIMLPISPGMRILDLGCGKGISSILLAGKYDVTVFAADLWISPTENAERFATLGVDSKIFPLRADATKEIPFAHEYFDMIISVDAWQYFGSNDGMLTKLLPFVKKDGLIAVAVPGFIQDYSEGNLPEVVKPFWTPDWYFYSCSWWKALWEKEPGIEITLLREMDSCQQAWDDFMECSLAQEMMVPIMEAGAGEYFNMIQIVGRKV